MGRLTKLLGRAVEGELRNMVRSIQGKKRMADYRSWKTQQEKAQNAMATTNPSSSTSSSSSSTSPPQLTIDEFFKANKAKWAGRNHIPKDTTEAAKDFLYLFSKNQVKAIIPHMNSIEFDTLLNKWDTIFLAKVGGILLKCFMSSAQYPPSIAAFTHHYEVRPKEVGRPLNYKTTSIIRASDAVFAKLIELGSGGGNSYSLKYLPMVFPPRNWTGLSRGGYYHLKSTLMRAWAPSQQKSLMECGMGSFRKVTEGLDYLGSIPWRINTDVLSVVEEIWEKGWAVGHVPSKHKLEVPDYDTKKFTTMEEYNITCKTIEKRNKELYSLRCDFLIKLGIAQQFKGDTIYFPHNIDFRGRAYPISQNLHHMSSDLSRGLLLFSERRELGEGGLRWLKIHLANLFGNNKISYDDREQWTNDRLDQISQILKNPLEKGVDSWWMEAEDPFQALAAIFEIAKASEMEDASLYETSLPVHQDGTCNGLQHYAAMGRDEGGAFQVNLSPAPLPQDVYGGVCEEVNKILEKHKKSGNPQQMSMALFLDGLVDRKVVKQTVMTSGLSYILFDLDF